ncbi:MAG: ABC transporter permease [Spirochaetales bacterium]|nr:ABC transporter permease [Spirochaetales bacterium]
MSKLNKTLILGMTMLIFLILVAIAGPSIAPYPDDWDDKIHTSEEETSASPFPPSEGHLMGTDFYGYDMFSMILRGARYTLFFCLAVSLVRVVLGTVAALFIGWRSREIKSSPVLGGLAAVPIVIFLYLLFAGVSYNSPVPPWILAIFQGIVIMLFGLPGVIGVLEEKVADQREKSYVEAAVSSGAGPVRILFKHILPFLIEPILIIFSHETISVLTIIGQLGILNMFIGGARIQFDPVIFLSNSHEWAGLIGNYKGYISSASNWLILFPLMAYFLVLVALYLFSRGLEKYFHRKYGNAPHV